MLCSVERKACTGDTSVCGTQASVSVLENLMYDHGLLKRSLNAIRHIINELEGEDCCEKRTQKLHFLLKEIYKIFHNYIHPIHEELEEKFVFKPLIEANIRAAECKELWSQHKLGKRLSAVLENPTKYNHHKLCQALTVLCDMYDYHEAIEDTQVFPALYKVVDVIEMERNLLQDASSVDPQIACHMIRKITAVEQELGIFLAIETKKSQDLISKLKLGGGGIDNSDDDDFQSRDENFQVEKCDARKCRKERADDDSGMEIEWVKKNRKHNSHKSHKKHNKRDESY